MNDVVGIHMVLFQPLLDPRRYELRTIVVAAQTNRSFMLLEQPSEGTNDIDRGQTAPHFNGQAFSGELVDDCQARHLASVLGLVKDKIVAPHVVRIFGTANPLGRHPPNLAFMPLSDHLQALAASYRPDPLAADPVRLRAHQVVNLSIPEVGTLP